MESSIFDLHCRININLISERLTMTTFGKLTLLFVAFPLALAPTLAQAGGFEYYEDGYGGTYYSKSYGNGFRSGDAAAALGLGLIGGMALGAIAATPAPTREVIVQQACYRAWRDVWNDHRGAYQRKLVRVCE